MIWRISPHDFFNGLSSDTLSLLEEFYHPNAEFVDPLVSLHGLRSIQSYYERIYKNVVSIQVSTEPALVMGHQAAVRWTTHLCARRLNGGRTIHIHGSSFFTFEDGLCTFHRDYSDLYESLYKHVPGLSFVTATLNKLVSDH